MHMKTNAIRLVAIVLSMVLALSSISIGTIAEGSDVSDTPDESTLSEAETQPDADVLAAEEQEVLPSNTPDEDVTEPVATESATTEPTTIEPVATDPVPEEAVPTEEPTVTVTPSEIPESPADDRTAIQKTLDEVGYAYVASANSTQVYSTPELWQESMIFTIADDNAVLLADCYDATKSIHVSFLTTQSELLDGFVAPNDLQDEPLTAEYLATLEAVAVHDIVTVIGAMTLYPVSGKKMIETPIETPLPDAPSYAEVGSYVRVAMTTRAFDDVDEWAAEEMYSSQYIGFFVTDAVVQVEEVLSDDNGAVWYKVRYLFGDDLPNGTIKWTDSDTLYVLASETEATDETECTVTDYAYSQDFLQMLQHTRVMLYATNMNGFSLKSISVNLGSFYEWQSGLYGSSGKDSAYPQIAKSAAHGTIYATPHYLEGYTVFCLEHNESGPGEGSAATGPYVLVDMDTFANDASVGGGVTGVRFSTTTMHAIAWVLRHAYPFMALDRSDSNNLVWSRVAGQFAIREVIKQLEGAQYVRGYWDMDNFYSFSGGAPSVYLTYARWLAENGIARASITGAISTSNKSLSVSGSSYIGSVKVTTDADLIRIPKSVGTLTGNSGGSDSSYYYAASGDTIKVTSTQSRFTINMESISSDSEEANFLVGVPSVALQKVLVPTYGHPYPLKSASVTFELSLGAITVTKKSTDGILLPGTVFELLSAAGTVVQTVTTTASGIASFTGLAPGDYIVREKTASQGYSLAATSTQNVTVTAGVTSTATFTNARITGKVRIVKTDSQTSKPLAGATFSVIRLSCPPSDNAVDVGQVVATITTNASGVAETSLLPWGQYKITETGVPDGYLDAGYTVTTWIK